MNKKKDLSGAGFLVMFMLVAATLKAEIKLPAIFGDHMVLQQQTEAAIWGQAIPDKTIKVIVSWDKKKYTTRSDHQGKWKLKIKTPAADGPYTISLSDGKTLVLKDVLIGEVWVCSGQSNMFMPMRGYHNQPVYGSNEAIVRSSHPSIRLFTVKKNVSARPLDDFTGQWNTCIPEHVADFSAAAYFFGRMIQQSLHVPVGLIASSWGGTRIEPWISETGVRRFDFVTLPDKDMPDQVTRQTPTALFNAMIHPMAGYAIRGGLWYQGEANRKEPGKYRQLLPGLVKSWREEWQIGDFPFYYAQIAPFDYPGDVNSAFLREAQLKASAIIPNSGMACLMDTGKKNVIHPPDKEAAGERLAYLALVNTYGRKGFESAGPELKEMTVDGDKVKLTFNHAKNGLTTFGKELTHFTLAGEDKHFYPAEASITRSGIVLHSSSVDRPVAVRYAFEDFVVGELYNTEGLPASSFRTDNWEK